MKKVFLFIVTTLVLFSCKNQIEVQGLAPFNPQAVTTSVNLCPTGYILVPKNESLSVESFCVMEYEAKAWQDDNGDSIITNNELDETEWVLDTSAFMQFNWINIESLESTHQPVSTLDKRPWDLSATAAWDVCDSLNSELTRNDIDNDQLNDGTYALISNPEWMAIARNIEEQAANWTSGNVGVGCLKQGNISSLNNCVSGPSSFDGPDMSITGAASGVQSSVNPLASHILNNGEVIWDFSGGVSEWVDWEQTNSFTSILIFDKASTTTGITPNISEFMNLDTNIAPSDTMFHDSWSPLDATLMSSSGIGRYNGNSVSFAFTSEFAANRGGSFSSNIIEAGIYNLQIGSAHNVSTRAWVDIFGGSSGENPLYIGFRCVLRL